MFIIGSKLLVCGSLTVLKYISILDPNCSFEMWLAVSVWDFQCVIRGLMLSSPPQSVNLDPQMLLVKSKKEPRHNSDYELMSHSKKIAEVTFDLKSSIMLSCALKKL